MVSHQQKTKVRLPGTRRQQKQTTVKKVVCRPKRGLVAPLNTATNVPSDQQRITVRPPGTRSQQKRTAVKKLVCKPKHGPVAHLDTVAKVVSHFGNATYRDVNGTLVSGEVLFIGPPGTVLPPAGTCITVLGSAAPKRTAALGPESGEKRQDGAGSEADVPVHSGAVPQESEKGQAKQDPEGGKNKQAAPAPENGAGLLLPWQEKKKRRLERQKQKKKELRDLKKQQAKERKKERKQKAAQEGQSNSTLCPVPPQCSQPQSLSQKQPHTTEEAELAGAEGASTATDRKKRKQNQQGNQPATRNLVQPATRNLVRPATRNLVCPPSSKLDAYPAPPAFGPPPPRSDAKDALPANITSPPTQQQPQTRRNGAHVLRPSQPWAPPLGMPPIPGLGQSSQPVPTAIKREPQEAAQPEGRSQMQAQPDRRSQMQAQPEGRSQMVEKSEGVSEMLAQPDVRSHRLAQSKERYQKMLAQQQAKELQQAQGQQQAPRQQQIQRRQQAQGQQQGHRMHQQQQTPQEEFTEPEQQPDAGVICLWRPSDADDMLASEQNDDLVAAEQKDDLLAAEQKRLSELVESPRQPEQKPLSEPRENLRPGRDSAQAGSSSSSSSGSSGSEPDEGEPAASAPNGVKSITVGRANVNPVAPTAVTREPAARKHAKRSQKHTNKRKRWSSEEGETLVRIVNDTEFRRATLKTRKMGLDWERVGKFFGRTAVGVQQHYYGCSKRAKADA